MQKKGLRIYMGIVLGCVRFSNERKKIHNQIIK